MLSNLLDRHHGADVVSIALNTGNFSSNAYRYVHGVQKLLTSLVLYSVSEGARTQLWARTAPQGEFKGGEVRGHLDARICWYSLQLVLHPVGSAWPV